MKFKRHSLLRRYGLIAIVLLLGVRTPWARGQLVTWVLPSDQEPIGLKITSAVSDIQLRVVHGKTGAPVQKIGDLGWRYEKFELGDVLYAGGEGRADTHPVKLIIDKLPPGRHKIFLRYWAKAFGADQQWYVFMASLDGNPPADTGKEERIVSGLGGKMGAMYEIELGHSGTAEKPASQVVVNFDRYIWGRIARFGGVRIETEINVQIPKTSESFLNKATLPIYRRLMSSGPKDATGQAAYGVGVTSGTIKVRPKSFDSLVDMPLSNTLSLKGARGEWVSAQVVIFSPKCDLKMRRPAVSELKPLRAGRGISADQVMVAPIGYLGNNLPSEPETHGWWPEPILTFLDRYTIRQGDVQSLWFRVRIPRDTPAGEYEGQLTLAPENGPVCVIPIKLTVWDFAIPKAFTLRLVLNTNLLPEEYLLDYGINPTSIYSSGPPSLGDLSRWAKDGRVNAFNLLYLYMPNMDPATGLPRAKDLKTWLSQIETCLKNAESVGLKDKAYVYFFDEGWTEAMPAMKAVSEAIAKRFPNLLLLTTSGLEGRHGLGPQLSKINGWCVLLNFYNDELAKQARQKGKQVWWYVCNIPREPYPNITILEPGINHRLLMGFLPYAAGTEGFLYYAMTYNWGRSQSTTPPITQGPYVTDYWQVWNRGDGTLCQMGPNGPLPSLRLELIRDGLEDYEYLHLAQKLSGELSDKPLPPALEKQLKIVQSYFKWNNAVARSVTDFTKNPATLEDARNDLAGFIVEAGRFLNSQKKSVGK